MLRKPRILGIFSGMIPSAVIYVIKPLQKLVDEGSIEFEYVLEPNLTVERIRRSDLIVFSRNYLPEYGFALDEALSAHIPTVYDIDDNFWELTEDTYVGRLHRFPPRMKQMESYLKRVDLVRTFSPRLYKIVKERFNHKVVLATPGIDFSMVSDIQEIKENEKVTISYVTSRGAEDELMELFSDDLKRILETYPDKAQAVFWGTVPDLYRKCLNAYSKPIIYDYDGYIRNLASGEIQIGLAPLIPSEFYLSKTNTKFRDYSLCRIAGIYSDVDTYNTCVTQGETGLLVKQEPGAWFDAMQKLIDDDQLRKKIRDQAYQYVFKHHRQEIMEQEWGEIIRKLVLSPVDGGIKDLAERARVHTQGVQKEGSRIGLYLGRVTKPVEGLIHVAPANPLPGGVIADLSTLPFKTGSVDLLVSDHILDGAEDVSTHLQEFYRVCADRAQLSLVASYANQAVNLARPETNRGLFNEHTPRYWTSSPWSGVDLEEYETPGHSGWGLGNPDPRLINLICLRIAFFYYPIYRNLSAVERRESRRKYLDVCDEIVYHLLVCKTPLSEDEMSDTKDQLTYYEPEHVVNRRFQETIEQLKTEIDITRDQINVIRDERNKFERLYQNSERELAQKRTILDVNKAQMLIKEVSGLRSNIAFRLFRRLRDRTDATKNVAESSQKLLDDSRMFCGSLAGFKLQVSDELNGIPFLPYTLYPRAGSIKEISFSFVIDWPPDQGEVGVEFVDHQGNIMQQANIPAREIQFDLPTTISVVPPILSDGMPIVMRLFTRNVNYPVRVFEWRKYRLMGLGKIENKPFCGLSFVNS